MSTFEDDEAVEQMIAALREALDEDPDEFSEWEREFIRSVQDQNDGAHLSEKQCAKIEELYDEHC